jgi:hypothetical protein
MPITPGSAGASFDVLLAFSLDEEANRRVQQGITTMEAELKRLQELAGKVGPEYQKSGEQVKKTSKDTATQLRAEARAMRAEVASMTSDVRNLQIKLLRDISSTISGISTKALLAGGAIVGGIFAEVQRYVSEAPDATRETQAWAAATENLGRARKRVDQELLTTALPLLQQAARVANQAAGIVERHPEITSLALKAGTILVGVGVIGTAVSKGIKLVADIQYLATIPTQIAAAKLQDLAADKQLTAARVSLKNAGGEVPGGGGSGKIGSILATASFVAAGLIASAAAVSLLDGLLERSGFGDARRSAINQARDQGARIYPGALPPAERQLQAELNRAQLAGNADEVKRLRGEIDNLGNSSEKVGEDISKAAGQIAGSANEAAIVEAFSSWKEDDARLIREAADNRKEILADAERQIADITRDYANERVGINRRFSDQRTSIERSFAEESQRAEEDYLASRSQALAEGNQQIRDMEEEHQERLRQLRAESADRQEDLTASRDALGLVKEQRRLADAESEENRSIRREAARARRETDQRIAELDNQYAIEKTRRQAQFEQDLRDNEAERAEELQQAAAAHQEELRQAREATAAKLRELQEGLNAERTRRREVFLAQIADLDASLLGERALRQRAYNDMLADAQAFFNAYRAALPSGSSFGSVTGSVGTIPTRDKGGYMSRGLYGVAMNGIPEFALSGDTTKAAERAIGSTLTDEGLSRLFGRVGDMRTAVYNDNRRLDAPLSKDARAIYTKTAEEAIRRVIGVR